jgi:DNA-binding NarL/FixJ family response regulator
MISVVVADDQALVRAGFSAMLDAEEDITLVAEASDGAEAVGLCHEHHPDVVLMDIRMPNVDGIAATRQLCTEPTGPRVVMLTTFDLDNYVYQALRAGASGFLLKDVSRARLVDAVRLVAAGEALLAPSVTRRLIEAFVRRPPPSDKTPAAFAELSQRELEVLRHLAAGLSNREIAMVLYVSEATIKTHVAHILTKLGIRDRVQAVVAAYDHGFARPLDHPPDP